MGRIASASVLLVLLGLAPVTGFTAPIESTPAVPTGPSIIFVDGWWEQEHREQDAREGYWRLRQRQQARYNRLQAEIDALQQQRRDIDQRIARDLEEQHRLLGFDRR